ncbi:hypothetical protein DSO57_1028223 [Entomophthora muscae]|uniref:Uncharacterized protein n=1 Tax=Entomophthora muscae TaxID=34485 RepID=A0ACC2TZF3_9FUNG|nr:hypothetical protein DSO57_1028223 [Entomophthora muscae]
MPLFPKDQDKCLGMPAPGGPQKHMLPVGYCGVPVHQSPKCVLDHSQGPAGRGSKWSFICSQKEDPLRNLLVYGLGGQGNNIDLPIIGVLQQYLGHLVLDLGLLLLSLGPLLLRLGLPLLRIRIRLLR